MPDKPSAEEIPEDLKDCSPAVLRAMIRFYRKRESDLEQALRESREEITKVRSDFSLVAEMKNKFMQDRDYYKNEAKLNAEGLASLREEVERLKGYELVVANIEGIMGHSPARSDMRVDSAVRLLVDRFAEQTQQLFNERSRLAELSKPVTREEIEAIIGPDTLPGDAAFRLACLAMADKLILSRQPKASQPEEPK